jgi:hypothetical protein
LSAVAAPTRADAPAQDARSIVESAIAAAGGDSWLNPQTLELWGSADFYTADRPGPVRHVDDYHMWRAMTADRVAAHNADGKVRIRARHQGKPVFEVGFDGQTTWNDKGIVRKAEADAYWASNFGFGIIRRALHKGFKLERAPDRTIDGHALDMVRIVDPGGQTTLFGIDHDSRFVRYMGFATPRGWHERVYDDFVMLTAPRWLQAREVTLFYNGVRQNSVHWRKVTVDAPLDPEIFAPPPGVRK